MPIVQKFPIYVHATFHSNAGNRNDATSKSTKSPWVAPEKYLLERYVTGKNTLAVKTVQFLSKPRVPSS